MNIISRNIKGKVVVVLSHDEISVLYNGEHYVSADRLTREVMDTRMHTKSGNYQVVISTDLVEQLAFILSSNKAFEEDRFCHSIWPENSERGTLISHKENMAPPIVAEDAVIGIDEARIVVEEIDTSLLGEPEMALNGVQVSIQTSGSSEEPAESEYVRFYDAISSRISEVIISNSEILRTSNYSPQTTDWSSSYCTPLTRNTSESDNNDDEDISF